MATTMQPTEANVEKLTFTAREVCQSISVSSTTLWRFEKQNILKPLPGLGRHRLYSVADVRRLAERGAVAS